MLTRLLIALTLTMAACTAEPTPDASPDASPAPIDAHHVPTCGDVQCMPGELCVTPPGTHPRPTCMATCDDGQCDSGQCVDWQVDGQPAAICWPTE